MDKRWLSGQDKTLNHPRTTLTIALIIVLFAVLSFAVLAWIVVQNGPLDGSQTPLVRAMHQRALAAPNWETTFWLFMGDLGQWAIIGLALILGLLWLFNKMWRELAMLVIGVPGGALWFIFLAQTIDRHRPIFVQPIHPINFPGFPSGHLVSSTTFYGLLLYLYALKPARPVWRWIILAVFIILMGLISYSRLYLGDHYLTDVLAGFAVGLAWSALIYALVDWIDARRKAGRVSH